MITIQKDYPLNYYPEDVLVRLFGTAAAPHGKSLFLDIETTGLSSLRSRIYLTGVIWPDESGWHFRQWFCEQPEEESLLLREMLTCCGDASELIHFNGDRFDLPFLAHRADRYGLDAGLLSAPSRDLLRSLRHAKSLLPLPDGKLKTWEKFLGIAREDTYGGGELIQVYKDYVKHPTEEARKLLLLHNEEDILAMPRLLPALAYTDLAKGYVQVTSCICEESRQDTAAAPLKEITFLLTTDLSIPQPILLTTERARLYLRDNRIRMTLPVFTGELKYFFPDPKNYYYLPAEDMAVHRSVGAFVERDYRRPATAATAYIRHTSDFLPGFPDLPEVRLFRADSKDTLPYLTAEELTSRSPEWWTIYLRDVIASL